MVDGTVCSCACIVRVGHVYCGEALRTRRYVWDSSALPLSVNRRFRSAMLDIKPSADYLSRSGTFSNFSMLFAGSNTPFCK